MATPTPPNAHQEQEAIDGQAPALRIYQTIHQGREIPPLGQLDENGHTRLILFNVQGFSTQQIWTEISALLGDMAQAIVKVKHVSGLNRNPHADVWVQMDLASALLTNICCQTRYRTHDFYKIVTEEDRLLTEAFPTARRKGDKVRRVVVTHW